MRLYLAGPMRGIREWNYPVFRSTAAALRRAGHEVFDPSEEDFDPTGMDGTEDLAALGFDLRAALKKDTAWICEHADAVAVLPGWKQSAGATAEVALARAIGIPVHAAVTLILEGMRERSRGGAS